MLKLYLGFLVDTLFCVKWLAILSIFIHADILVLVSEFLVVVILSEWWLGPTTADRCGHIPALRRTVFVCRVYIMALVSVVNFYCRQVS